MMNTISLPSLQIWISNFSHQTQTMPVIKQSCYVQLVTNCLLIICDHTFDEVREMTADVQWQFHRSEQMSKWLPFYRNCIAAALSILNPGVWIKRYGYVILMNFRNDALCRNSEEWFYMVIGMYCLVNLIHTKN